MLARLNNAVPRHLHPSTLLQLLPLLALALLLWWLAATVSRALAPAAPQLRVTPQPQPQAAAGLVAQQSWFGQLADPNAARVAPPVEVIGVLGGGGSNNSDFAILVENGQRIALRVGATSPGGWQLLRVQGGGVTLRQGEGGAEQFVALSRAAGSAGAAANMATPGALPPADAVMPPLAMPPATGNAAAPAQYEAPQPVPREGEPPRAD